MWWRFFFAGPLKVRIEDLRIGFASSLFQLFSSYAIPCSHHQDPFWFLLNSITSIFLEWIPCRSKPFGTVPASWAMMKPTVFSRKEFPRFDRKTTWRSMVSCRSSRKLTHWQVGWSSRTARPPFSGRFLCLRRCLLPWKRRSVSWWARSSKVVWRSRSTTPSENLQLFGELLGALPSSPNVSAHFTFCWRACTTRWADELENQASFPVSRYFQMPFGSLWQLPSGKLT